MSIAVPPHAQLGINHRLDSPTVGTSSFRVLEITENLAIVWYGTPCQRKGESWLVLESCSERMGCANRPGLARPQQLPAASQSASSTSYVRGCFCVPAARSHPIRRLHHHRSVECCLAHRVYAYPSCSQTDDSPKEIHGFCTNPKERAGSCVGSSLEERERVLDTRIELASTGIDVDLCLFCQGFLVDCRSVPELGQSHCVPCSSDTVLPLPCRIC